MYEQVKKTKVRKRRAVTNVVAPQISNLQNNFESVVTRFQPNNRSKGVDGIRLKWAKTKDPKQLMDARNNTFDLNGLNVPKSQLDETAYDYNKFERPTGWYGNTFDVLASRQDLMAIDDPYNKREKIQVVKCAVTDRACTVDGVDIGHIIPWREYVKSKNPTTVREAVNAYNDLNNLRLESAGANRSGDFEMNENGNFIMTEAERKEITGSSPSDNWKGKNMNEYDMEDSFIDDSEV